MSPNPVQPGWYDDPKDLTAQRYWDGDDWTPRRKRRQRPAPVPTHAPPPQPFPPPPPTYTLLPGGPPPPAAGWAPPNIATGGIPPSDRLPTVRAAAGRISITTWLLFGGLIIATVAVFMPYASISLFGIDLAEVPLPWKYRVIALALIAGSAALAWPTLSAATVETGRRTGLSVLAVLMIVVTLLAFIAVFRGNSAGGRESMGVAGASPGSGLIVFAAAVVIIVVAVVRLWLRTSAIVPPSPGRRR